MSYDVTEANSPPGSSWWARPFALVYNPFLWAGERSGLRARRKALLGWARGRTAEIGAGTGLNLPCYPDGLDELYLLEPDRAMRSRLERTLGRTGRPARLVDAPAERLPFTDESIDTVVSTLVLCTVDAPDLALQEIKRVLRPDGRLLFIEHVRSESPRLASWQDLLANPWRNFGRGCRCNRPTAALMVNSGFELEDVEKASWRAMPPIVRPLIVGRARAEAAVTGHGTRVAAHAGSKD